MSDSSAVVSYIERPYTTCSFQVVCVSADKMVYWKETADVSLEP